MASRRREIAQTSKVSCPRFLYFDPLQYYNWSRRMSRYCINCTSYCKQTFISSRYDIGPDNTLTMRSVQRSQEGNYSCHVNNKLGSDEIVYSLQVQGNLCGISPLIDPPTTVPTTTTATTLPPITTEWFNILSRFCSCNVYPYSIYRIRLSFGLTKSLIDSPRGFHLFDDSPPSSHSLTLVCVCIALGDNRYCFVTLNRAQTI